MFARDTHGFLGQVALWDSHHTRPAITLGRDNRLERQFRSGTHLRRDRIAPRNHLFGVPANDFLKVLSGDEFGKLPLA